MERFDNTRPIGFFDSGVGGLSVYKWVREILPNENTIYFGDLLHLPYGNKSKNELIGYARTILNFLKEKNVKAVVIACNTSSAQAYDTIKDEYNFKIYPIIQSCAKIIASSGYNKIGVFATEATVSTKKYSSEINSYDNSIEVKEISQKSWVSIVENNVKDSDEAKKNIKNDIREMLDYKPDKIILGCTHYPYLLNELCKYAPKDLFIDPAEIFSKYIASDIQSIANTSSALGKEEFYVSAKPEDFIKNASLFYNVKKSPICTNIFYKNT